MIDFISLPGVFITLNLATTPSRSMCKHMTPKFIMRRERIKRSRCQSWIALFLFVAWGLLCKESRIQIKKISYSCTWRDACILECAEQTADIPEYEVNPPHFGNNWCKSTGEAKSKQPCSNLMIVYKMHAYDNNIIDEELFAYKAEGQYCCFTPYRQCKCYATAVHK